MTAVRKVAAVLILLFATNVWAYRGRPVTDLRFDGRSQESYVQAVATDGEDFLAIVSYRVPYAGQRHVFTQKIVDARPVGPQHRIASGQAMDLVWTGNKYLALWDDAGVRKIGRLSRDGSLIAIAPQLSFVPYRLIANGERVLAIAGGTVQPLDADGNPAGPVVTHTFDGATTGSGPAENVFPLLFGNGTELRLLLLRADGTANWPAPVVVATVDNGPIAEVATDGTDTLIAVRDDRSDAPERLRTIVVGANGAVKSERTIYTHLGVTVDAMRPRGLIWDGSRYVLAVGLQRTDGRMDAAMFTIARNGERIGDLAWIVEKPRDQRPTALAWNGRELLMTFHTGATSVLDQDVGSYCVTVNPATMTGSTPTPLARTLGPHDQLTVAAGNNGYLGAWFDHGDGLTTTLRVSRIDRQGNYLDGEGMVLGTMPHPQPYAVPTIAIEADGPQWLVVWSTGTQIRAREVSRAGQPGVNTIAIGPGEQADVVWNGSHYVVLRSDDSLHRDIVQADGTIASTTVLAQYEEIDDLHSIRYSQPVLTRLGDETIGIYVKDTYACPPPFVQPTPCTHEGTVMGRRVETDAAPFVIATGVWGEPAVAANGSQALVTWSQYGGPRGAFLSATQPQQPGAAFPVAVGASVAADGSDFLLVGGSFQMQRVGSTGAVSEPIALRLDDTEISTLPVIASSTTLPPLIGFLQRHIGSDSVPRATLLFASELDDEAVAPPPSPTIVCATKNADDTISVRWQPMQNILGISIELEVPDGTFRQIDVAPAGATSARVSRAGLDGDAVRVRAWNAGGLSEPSSIAPSLPAPIASLRSTMRACASTPATINISVNGTPPFTIRWSDGFVQSNVNAMTATRTVTLTHDLTLSIVSVADASCAISEVPESIRITVDAQPAIAEQTHAAQVSRGDTATLTVTANEGAHFTWFQGSRGDTSHPVGQDSRSLTTPPLSASTRYWVRVSNRCGSVDSQEMVVTVSGKRRSARG